ncbi:hypothetical protein CFP65_3722 [Kitasatospora sp. MMS16-BH015]|uniref:hypothetical protein n=1 Tax=Kitasatospora sp. MMS16-BH015 TaxID=2018025 RepID=UPI000CA1DAAD|nr:hypothetical protein [Kitasatospora sp. MMS16-BH015]AUG78508.1 hypothetical protein CFP65_3722 [Kitasatospora sp. MMS16-BH015]
MDTDTYPIVDEKPLERLPRARRFSLGSPARQPGDLPAVASHQKLVYRVGDTYLVEDGDRPLNDPVLRAATSVTVVDCRKDVSVVVDLKLGSHEAEQFTVRAEFACAVLDAARVVEDGRRIRANLLAYLNGCPRIHDIGQQHGLDELFEVRELVQTQIRAYTEIQPPAYPGMAVRVVGTDVLTPAILKEQEHTRRAAEREHEEAIARRERELRLTRIDQQHSHLVRTDKLDKDHEYDTRARGYQRETRQTVRLDEVDERLHGHDLQDLDQRGELGRRRRSNEFARQEYQADEETVGASLARQVRLSYQRGEIGERELFERLDRLERQSYDRGLTGRSLDREDYRWDVQRDDARAEALRREEMAELDRRRIELQARTEERRTAAAQEREDRRWKVERDDRRADQRYQAARDERMAALQRRYEDQQRRLEMRFELRRSAIQKGYGDSSVEELERFVDGLEDYARREEDPQQPVARGRSGERRELDESAPGGVRMTKEPAASPGGPPEDGPGEDLADDLWKYEG